MMQTVYRVERVDGEGPYCALGYSKIHLDGGDDAWSPWSAHPAPRVDGMDEYEGKAFGFPSLDALQRWFDRDARTRLQAKGFHVAVYTVARDVVVFGRKQCAFLRECASCEVTFSLI
jgi:hypothetical protein